MRLGSLLWVFAAVAGLSISSVGVAISQQLQVGSQTVSCEEVRRGVNNANTLEELERWTPAARFCGLGSLLVTRNTGILLSTLPAKEAPKSEKAAPAATTQPQASRPIIQRVQIPPLTPIVAPRIALVVGNAAYQVPSWRLQNPVRDAELMRQRLLSLGFDVDFVANANKEQLTAALRRFGQRLRGAGRNAVSFVYYAGHGAEDNGVNYLVPTDADVRTSDELRFAAPPVQFLLDDMARVGNSVNIVVLDACRDMPLPNGARSLTRGGLAPLAEAPNVLIAYATAPGQTAPDGTEANSIFTSTLAAALAAQQREPIELLFSDVQSRVQQRTGGAQRPRFSNGLAVSRWSFAATPVNRSDVQAAVGTTMSEPSLASRASKVLKGQTLCGGPAIAVVEPNKVRFVWPRDRDAAPVVAPSMDILRVDTNSFSAGDGSRILVVRRLSEGEIVITDGNSQIGRYHSDGLCGLY